MLALRWGERALPLAWRVERTDGAIGFEIQRSLLGAVAPWLPEQAKVRLLGDRFYGTADLIGWCQEHGWDYRLRLKGNLVVFDGAGRTTTGQGPGLLFGRRRADRTAGANPYRHHPRSGARRALDHRDVRKAWILAHA